MIVLPTDKQRTSRLATGPIPTKVDIRVYSLRSCSHIVLRKTETFINKISPAMYSRYVNNLSHFLFGFLFIFIYLFTFFAYSLLIVNGDLHFRNPKKVVVYKL